jgi:site-specific DNA recombinase
VRDLKRPIQEQHDYILKQLSQTQKNIDKFISMIERTDAPPDSMLDKIFDLEAEKKHLLERRSEIEQELNIPTIKEVSFEQVYYVLNAFSKVITKAEPEKQKDLLHTIINRITVNEGNRPDQRSVKDIELFFDASLREEFVLTYGTVHRA